MTPDSPLVRLEDVRKVYDTGAIEVEALREIDLIIHPNEFVAIVGPSGSGKSTLLNLLGCLDRPTDGLYELAGEDVSRFDAARLADVRNRRVGFIFQAFHLLPHLTAFDNVALPLLFLGRSKRQRKERAEELLERVGLADRMHHRPTELSGGQMQRVAIARALACEPDLLLADEPTGNLDSRAGSDVLALFAELRDAGQTLVVITHDPGVAAQSERVVTIQDGRIASDGPAQELAAS